MGHMHAARWRCSGVVLERVLLATFLYVAPALAETDDFNRPDDTNLSANCSTCTWVESGGASGLSIRSNRVENAATGSDDIVNVAYRDEVYPNDQFSEADVTPANVACGAVNRCIAGVGVRWQKSTSSNPDYGYLCVRATDGVVNRLEIRRYLRGSATVLASALAPAWGTFRCEAVGSTITFSVNGSVRSKSPTRRSPLGSLPSRQIS